MSANNQSTTWAKQSGYIWSLLGSAVGFANIVTFSAQCYRNGGGAFLLPFLLAMAILGLPMLYLESMMGHRWKSPLVGCYEKVLATPYKIFGWLAVIAVTTIGAFYLVLTGYTVAYMGFSAFGMIPADTASFFVHDVLKESSGLTDTGEFSATVFFATALVIVFTAYVMQKGIQNGIESTCSVFLPLLSVLVVVCAIASACLPGAMVGWANFLTPDFSRLTDPYLWRDVFGHLFYSFSLGLGIVVGYSRHTGKQVNIVEAMRWVAFGDFAISVVAGLAVFGCMGYMSHISGVPFAEIVSSESTFEIGFIAFPLLLQQFGPLLSQVFGVVFFGCLFIAGITGVFSIVEAIVGNIEVEWEVPREKAVRAVLVLLCLLTIPFCMGNGGHLINTLVPMVMGTNMLIGGLVQIVVFCWISREIRKDLIWNTDWQTKISYWLLATVAPTILFLILCGNVWQDCSNITLAVIVRWTWFVCAIALAAAATYGKKWQPVLIGVQQE